MSRAKGSGIGGHRGGGRRCRGTWSPPASSAHLPMPDRPSLGMTGQTFGWTSNPDGHLVLYKPSCSLQGCETPAMVWQRCGPCRAVFARCSDHTGHGAEVSEERAAHDCQAPDAKVISMAAERKKREDRGG